MADKNVVFIAGYPGAGKGTISQRYCLENSGVYHISAGDLIRDIITQKVESKFRDKLMTTGDKKTKTSPASLISDIVSEKIYSEHYELYLLDGFPQRYEELDCFMDKENNIKIIGSIFFDATMNNCVKRMISRGLRDFELLGDRLTGDDLVSYYEQRYKKYDIKTENILGILEKCRLKRLDANQTISVVYNQFCNIMLTLTQKEK